MPGSGGSPPPPAPASAKSRDNGATLQHSDTRTPPEYITAPLHRLLNRPSKRNGTFPWDALIVELVDVHWL